MEQTASARYRALCAEREHFLTRARDCARLTIPYVFPEEGDNGTTNYLTPFQSTGAQGVGSLSSQMLQSLFPVNGSFFRLRLDEAQLGLVQRAQLDQDPRLSQALDAQLADIERGIGKQFEVEGLRVALAEAMPHLVIGGNACLHYDADDKRWRTLSLDKYAVQRSPMGKVLELVVCEPKARQELSEEMLTALRHQHATAAGDYADPNLRPTDFEANKYFKLYTAAHFEDGKYNIWQEIDGVRVPNSDRKVVPEKLPWIPARFSVISGQNYGRGRVEPFYGDLSSLESLQEAIVKGSAAAAKIIGMVQPNGTTRLDHVSKAKHGDFIVGNAAEVTFLRVEKANDMQVAMASAEGLRQALQVAFLMRQSVQRQAERVTAEEIRIMAQALEETLGGTYTTLTQELQVPIVKFYLDKVTLPEGVTVPEEAVPSIVAGLEALGRGQEFQRLVTALQIGQSVFGEAMPAHLNMTNAIGMMFDALSLDSKRLLKPIEQLQAEQQAAQQQAMAAKLGPEMIRQRGQMAQAQAEAPQ